MEKLKVCIIGAGAGGMALGGFLSLRGCSVSLYNRSLEKIRTLITTKEIDMRGEINQIVPIDLVTNDLSEAIKDAKVIMVAVPAMAHRDVAELMTPHLEDGQIIILNPGRTFGALEVRQVFIKNKVETKVIIAEAQSLIFACRVLSTGSVRILKIKNSVPLACIPSWKNPEIVNMIKPYIPYFIPGDNILHTGLSNIGGVFHPATTILNTSWVENTRGSFDFYHEGISKKVSKVIEQLDNERVAVAAALGIRVVSAIEWIYIAYSIHGSDLYEVIQNNPAYSGIAAPRNLNHRYITEDIPMSLVPISSLGDQLGVKTDTMKAIIHMASVIHETNYFEIGRTTKSLGLDAMSVKEILKLALEG